MSRAILMSSLRTSKADFLVRSAIRTDSDEIARLFMVSSDGVAAYIWEQLRQPGETLLEAGTRRYARDGVDFSWQNCLVAESRGRILGMMHRYPMHSVPGGGDDPVDPVLEPYSRLEADNTLYISSLAVDEEFRGLGLGGFFIDLAWQQSKALGLDGLSLICCEQNEGAYRLYRRQGFVERDRAAIVPHPDLTYQDGDAVLMVRAPHST